MTSTTEITRRGDRYLIDLARIDDQREAWGYVNVPARRWIKSRNDWARTWSTIELYAADLAELGMSAPNPQPTAHLLTVFNAVDVPDAVASKVMSLLADYSPDIYVRECDERGVAR